MPEPPPAGSSLKGTIILSCIGVKLGSSPLLVLPAVGLGGLGPFAGAPNPEL